MRVEDICTRQVQTIQASEPLAAAARQMRDRQVGSLIVVAPNFAGRVVEFSRIVTSFADRSSARPICIAWRLRTS